MKIVKVDHIYYGYGNGYQVWLNNPKIVWFIFTKCTLSLKWEFYVENGFLIIKAPGIAPTAPISVGPDILEFLTKKRYSKKRDTVFSSRKSPI